MSTTHSPGPPRYHVFGPARLSPSNRHHQRLSRAPPRPAEHSIGFEAIRSRTIRFLLNCVCARRTANSTARKFRYGKPVQHTTIHRSNPPSLQTNAATLQSVVFNSIEILRTGNITASLLEGLQPQVSSRRFRLSPRTPLPGGAAYFGVPTAQVVEVGLEVEI